MAKTSAERQRDFKARAAAEGRVMLKATLSRKASEALQILGRLVPARTQKELIEGAVILLAQRFQEQKPDLYSKAKAEVLAQLPPTSGDLLEEVLDVSAHVTPEPRIVEYPVRANSGHSRSDQNRSQRIEAALTRIGELGRQGLSQREIAETLTQEGIKRSSGTSSKWAQPDLSGFLADCHRQGWLMKKFLQGIEVPWAARYLREKIQ